MGPTQPILAQTHRGLYQGRFLWKPQHMACCLLLHSPLLPSSLFSPPSPPPPPLLLGPGPKNETESQSVPLALALKGLLSLWEQHKEVSDVDGVNQEAQQLLTGSHRLTPKGPHKPPSILPHTSGYSST